MYPSRTIYENQIWQVRGHRCCSQGGETSSHTNLCDASYARLLAIGMIKQDLNHSVSNVSNAVQDICVINVKLTWWPIFMLSLIIFRASKLRCSFVCNCLIFALPNCHSHQVQFLTTPSHWEVLVGYINLVRNQLVTSTFLHMGSNRTYLALPSNRQCFHWDYVNNFGSK
jgi:hypothetical protein